MLDVLPYSARRLRVQVLAASVVAILLLGVAGINSIRNQNATNASNAAGTAGQLSQDQASQGQVGQGQASQGSIGQDQAGQRQPASAAASGPMALPNTSLTSRGRAGAVTPRDHGGPALDCSGIPAGHLITGHSDDYTLSTGTTGYVYEFLCAGANGQRSGSELQLFTQTGDKLRYRGTLLHASAGLHVDFVTAGTDTIRIQASVTSASAGRVPGEVIAMLWDLSEADFGNGFGFTVADPCQREDLAAQVIGVPGAAAWRLVLRNRTATACALEGYPQVRARLASGGEVTAVPTLNGPAGGVTKAPVAPIIVLSPGASAAAIIERGAAAAGSCSRSTQLAVRLPTGVALSPLPVKLPGCGLVVHPLVGNARGSD